MIRTGGQSDISIGGDGDVVGRDKVVNNFSSKKTRLANLFNALSLEVKKDDKLQVVCDELNRYLTDKDTIGLEKKLEEGGFDSEYIINATEQKEYFSKKLYKYQEYQSAQYIYVDLLAKIKTNFVDLIYPLLQADTPDLRTINLELKNNIIDPILDALNIDGADDNILNFNAEEVKGMIYYLTGRCHIKWSK